MQNVAYAYKQSQAGTMGQGEVILMLFDGALRFLAQAREKIEAKDYAAKGVLISRAMDIVHELDSSLNMEAGGELAQNLHNLYFLCTTRLLQANMKLDLDKLDSVTGILNGLRSAFSQAMAAPEAQVACQQLDAKHAGQNGTPRPITVSAHLPGSAPRGVAGLMYGQQEAAASATPGPAAPQPAVAAAPGAPQALSVTPAAPAAPAAPLSGGFAARRLSQYGKLGG